MRTPCWRLVATTELCTTEVETRLQRLEGLEENLQKREASLEQVSFFKSCVWGLSASCGKLAGAVYAVDETCVSAVYTRLASSSSHGSLMYCCVMSAGGRDLIHAAAASARHLYEGLIP